MEPRDPKLLASMLVQYSLFILAPAAVKETEKVNIQASACMPKCGVASANRLG